MTKGKPKSTSSAPSEVGPDDEEHFTKLLETALKSERIIKCLKHAIVTDLQRDNAELKSLLKEKDVKISELENRVDDLEQYTRMDDLIINGLTVRHRSYARAVSHSNDVETNNTAFEEQIDSVEDQLLGFLGSQGIAIDKTEISACHVLKTKDPTNKPPIIIRLISRKSKINILKNGRKLKGTNVYVNEHLSRKNANISALARQLKRRNRIHSTFTRNCKVFVKTNGAPGVSRVVLIKDKSELDKFDGN